MQEIVFNSCPKGEAILSDAGFAEYVRLGGTAPDIESIKRDDPTLIAVIRSNTDLYRGHCSQPKIVALPNGMKWEIRSRGNREWIAALP